MPRSALSYSQLICESGLVVAWSIVGGGCSGSSLLSRLCWTIDILVHVAHAWKGSDLFRSDPFGVDVEIFGCTGIIDQETNASYVVVYTSRVYFVFSTLGS